MKRSMDDKYLAIRDGVRAQVLQFDSQYWQKIDAARAFPEAFVNALTLIVLGCVGGQDGTGRPVDEPAA